LFKKILINGYFLCRKLTGIERYACEITKRLDLIAQPDEISIIIPSDINNIPVYKNINIIRYYKKIPHILWQMFILQFFLLTHRQYIILDFGNTCLPFSPGIIFLHDIYCEIFPEDFTGLKEKIICFYNRWQYRLTGKKAKKIITVSEFSKNEISKTFNIAPSRINVIYSSADHVCGINTDESVFEQFPMLAKKQFYISLGSLSKRKNIRWILEYAVKHPESIFAISGTSLSTVKVNELDSGIPKNIILLGYLDDSKVKALMTKCKAFILPSYYEGFGLTPLEALSCGAQIIIAKATSLPEIYGNTAHYIDPFNTDIDLDTLLGEPVEKPDVILPKYSYDTSAEKVYKLIQEFTQ
jgi:glycosyltransferase involved in cell wall biosynthesis